MFSSLIICNLEHSFIKLLIVCRIVCSDTLIISPLGNGSWPYISVSSLSILVVSMKSDKNLSPQLTTSLLILKTLILTLQKLFNLMSPE